MTLSKRGAYPFALDVNLLGILLWQKMAQTAPHHLIGEWFFYTKLVTFPHKASTFPNQQHATIIITSRFIPNVSNILKPPFQTHQNPQGFFFSFSSLRRIEAGVDHYGSEVELVGRRLDFWAKRAKIPAEHVMFFLILKLRGMLAGLWIHYMYQVRCD